MWPFKPKKQPPRDQRNWNDDWRIGDTAECVAKNWHSTVEPWNRPAVGEKFTVIGFSDEVCDRSNIRAYMLHLKEWPVSLSCTAFRKVRTVEAGQSAVVEQILKASPGKDNVRPAKVPAS